MWVPGVSTNTAVHLQGKSCALKRRSHQRIWPRHKRAQFGPVLQRGMSYATGITPGVCVRALDVRGRGCAGDGLLQRRDD